MDLWFFKPTYGKELNSLIGHILCNRLNLRSEFHFNPRTNWCEGIAINENETHVSLADEVMKLIGDDKDGNEEVTSDEDREDISCSVYANQFRFRESITELLLFNFSLMMGQCVAIK